MWGFMPVQARSGEYIDKTAYGTSLREALFLQLQYTRLLLPSTWKPTGVPNPAYSRGCGWWHVSGEKDAFSKQGTMYCIIVKGNIRLALGHSVGEIAGTLLNQAWSAHKYIMFRLSTRDFAG